MNRLLTSSLLLVLSLAPFTVPGADSAALYTNTFEQAALDKVPEDMLVLNGGFAVKEEGGNKFLELPGAPLDTFGVLFGPTEAAGLAIQARISGSGTGRRFPTFGVGLNGVGGYKLQIAPAKKAVELLKGDPIVASAPFTWESGTWTVLKLRAVKVKEGEFKIEGKAWKHGQPEPKEWTIAFTDATETPAGRPSVWGMPFSGTPIRFDELQVTRALP